MRHDQFYTTKLVTAPTESAVPLSEAKSYLNIPASVTDHDGSIKTFTTSAIELVERLTHRKLMTQTHDMFLQDWPSASSDPALDPIDIGEYIKIPFGQLQEITYIKYRDTDGNWQAWTSSDYDVQNGYEPGRVYLAYNTSWPTSNLYPGLSIQVRFKCGYTSNQAIEQGLKDVVKLVMSEMFTNRSFDPADSSFFETLLNPWVLEGIPI